MVLILLVALNSIPAISFDATSTLMKAVPMGGSNLYACLSSVPVIGQVTERNGYRQGHPLENHFPGRTDTTLHLIPDR